MNRVPFHDELRQLQEAIAALAVSVREVIFRAVQALEHTDGEAGERIIAGDDLIDRRVGELEEECLKLLVLHQPLAGDLRTIGAALHILIDLERMADHGVDIARTAVRLRGEKLIKPLIDIPRMAAICQEMISRALDAYVQGDAGRAEALVALDDVVDKLYSQIFRELLLIMMQDPHTINQGTQLLFVASHLERIADHTTNLAEAVIYAVTGQRRHLND
jgi:phosphate transport system protein